MSDGTEGQENQKHLTPAFTYPVLCSLVLKPDHASESSGGLVTSQIAGPHLQSFQFSESGIRLENLHSNKFSDAANASGPGISLRNMAAQHFTEDSP